MADITPRAKRTVPKTVWLTPQEAADLERKCATKRISMPVATFMRQAVLKDVYPEPAPRPKPTFGENPYL